MYQTTVSFCRYSKQFSRCFYQLRRKRPNIFSTWYFIKYDNQSYKFIRNKNNHYRYYWTSEDKLAYASRINLMNIKPLQGTNGFTLIEILIATVIITIVSLGSVTLTVGIMHGNSFSKRLTTATTLVKDEIEDAKRKGYANVGLSRTDNYGTIANFGGYKR